jgi:lipopolysaccharide/colanic/teichoic acid biosynthesis glycosyltransferase
MNQPQVSGSKVFWLLKRFFDVIISLLLLPVMVVLALLLLILNTTFKFGPVFFLQDRMGLNCVCFKAIKFRTMLDNNTAKREFNDPLEFNRITWLGKILRQFRLDEVPQIINVLRGDMSLIGPRPDYYEHALIFVEKIEEYRWRHLIKPGISGLAQIRIGYAEGLGDTKKKVAVDLYYVKNASLSLDVKIFISTIITIFKRDGI